jgi:hypothetical protein
MVAVIRTVSANFGLADTGYYDKLAQRRGLASDRAVCLTQGGIAGSILPILNHRLFGRRPRCRGAY